MQSSPSANGHALNALHEKYMRHLQECRAQTADFLSRARAGTLEEQDYVVLRRMAHSLKGTGATFGYTGISNAGKDVEAAIDADPRDAKAVEAAAETLLLAFGQALHTTFGKTPSPVSAAPAASPLGTAYAPLTLLTADDDAAIRGIIQDLFSTKVRVIEAKNGREALSTIRDVRPDLVLLDDAMPEITGLKLLEILKQDSTLKNIPVIMLTATDGARSIAHAMNTGALDYITKPFNPATLSAKVGAHLKRLSACVLIVDADADIRAELAEKFRLSGLRVAEAAACEDALALARSHPPSLILVEHTVQERDRLLESLSQSYPQAAILILSDEPVSAAEVQHFKRMNADFTLSPDFPEQLVVHALNRLGLSH